MRNFANGRNTFLQELHFAKTYHVDSGDRDPIERPKMGDRNGKVKMEGSRVEPIVLADVLLHRKCLLSLLSSPTGVSLSLTVALLSLTVTVHTVHKTAEKTFIVIELVAILSAIDTEEQQLSQ